MSSDSSPLLPQATEHLHAGRFAECEAVCRQIVQETPRVAEAYRLLATVAYFRKDIAESGRMLQQAIQLRPDVGEYYDNLATLLMIEDRAPEAEQAARRGLALQPTATLYHRLGEALSSQSRIADAEEALRNAVELNPRHAASWFDLALVCATQGKLAESEQAYRQALAVQPDMVQALVNLGNVLQNLGRIQESLDYYRRAIALKPDLTNAHYNAANAFKSLGRFTDAIAGYEHALRLGPPTPEAHLNLGGVLMEQGRLEEAAEHYREALALRPSHASAHTNLLLCAQYRPGVTLAELARIHTEWNDAMAAPLKSQWRPHANSREPDRQLRLGFVSGDLGQHPVGDFLVRVLESLDPQEFSTVCYSDRVGLDVVSYRIQRAASAWRDIRFVPDEELASLVREDQIDILFDLSGHTHGNRLYAFARKPAPLAVTWLGYVGTTGLTAMDYLLTDRFMVPPGVEEHFTEKILRLPGGSVYCEPPAEAPDVGPLPALARGHVTFGSFNNPAKVNEQVVAVWSEILRRLPTARLVLKHRAWEDPTTRQRFVQLFAARGIDEGRLDMLGWSPMAEMLATYNAIDLALDPFPYTGGSTTLLALWMGVPVITCPGETVASRQSLSTLSHASMAKFVAADLPTYVNLAASLAEDLPRLAAVRPHVRERLAKSSLCDLDRFMTEFTGALREIWRDWCGQPADRDDVHLL